jgi:L-alanine-DL-glutamate epimerase-like enolase superfamily enzyme
MKIISIRLDRMRLPLDPPFAAAWDPVPRRRFDATLVRVTTDAGITGYGSGDTMDGFGAFAQLFIGTDPLQVANHVRCWRHAACLPQLASAHRSTRTRWRGGQWSPLRTDRV